MEKEETVELRWFFSVIRRKIWLIVGCVQLALALAYVVTSRRPPSYEASTTLLVIPAAQMNTSDYNTLMAGRLLALTYGQMLEERSTLETVISRLGLETTPEELARRVQAQPIKETQLVRLTVTDSSPARAALIANTVAEIFAESTDMLQQTRYQDYIADREADLAAQRKRVEETQAQVEVLTGMRAADEAELQHLQGLLVDYRNTLRTLQQDRQSLQQRKEEVEGQVRIVEKARAPAGAGVPTAGPRSLDPSAAARNPYPDLLARSLFPAVQAPSSHTATVTLLVDQGQIGQGVDYSGILASERLAATYAQIMTGPTILEAAIAREGGVQDPDIVRSMVVAEPITGTQLLQLKVTGANARRMAGLANAIAEVFVDQIREMRAAPYAGRLADTETQIASLSAQIDESEAEILALTEAKFQDQTELDSLEGQLAEYKIDYRTLQQNYEQLRLAAAQVADTVIVTERAHAPMGPVRDQWQYILLAALVAMLVAMGIAFLGEYLDDAINTPEAVSHVLGLNTLGSIEQFGKGDEELVVVSNPLSPAAEAFRVLAANLRFTEMDGRPSTVLVTSPTPAEGKSVLVANLAAAMASVGKRVVVVDTDLRLPRQHELFGLVRGQGLTDALAQGSLGDRLQSTEVEGVKVLTSGTLPLDPVVALSSPHMKEILADLAEDADLVIMDSPPVLPMADARILAAVSDGVLMLLQADRTRRPVARRALASLRQVGAHLIGAVLNAVPAERHDYYRYYDDRDDENRYPFPTQEGAEFGRAPEAAEPPATGARHFLGGVAATALGDGKWRMMLVIVVMVALLVAAHEPILSAAGDYLVIEDELEPADLIHVIAGPDDRTDHAIELYKQGYGTKIFFTGGWCESHGYFHGQHGVERADAQGIGSEGVDLDESPVTSTYDEAVLLRDYIARSSTPVRSVIVVSDPYHMRRAQWTYQTVLGEGVKVEMAPVPFAESTYKRRWWTDAASKQYVRDEYVKLAYYYARYRLSWGPLQQWLASLDVG